MALDSNKTSVNVSVNNDSSSNSGEGTNVSDVIQNSESLEQSDTILDSANKKIIETSLQSGEQAHWTEVLRNFPFRPLDLKITKLPSILDVAIKRESLANPNTHNDQNKIFSRSDDSDQKEKLKACNFAISVLKIGSWRRDARCEGDLRVKVYFARRELIWEILENSLKKKIEIQWNHIVGMKAVIEQNKPAILEIELSQPPNFSHETKLNPRMHTIWHPTQDFTNDQASLCRIHHLEVPSGAIDKHFAKLLRFYPRFMQLIQSPFPSLSSPYFTCDSIQGDGSRMPKELRVPTSKLWKNQGTGGEMNPDYIAPTNMAQEFKPHPSMRFGMQNKGQTIGCENRYRVAPTYVPIHGNGYQVDYSQPAAYPSNPRIGPAPHGQIYEQINRPSHYRDSSQRSDDGINNHIVDNTSMSYRVQGMESFQNHHQNYNLSITPNYEGLECLNSNMVCINSHMLSNIEQHLVDDSEFQYIDIQNLQENANSMHSLMDLHNEMNITVAPVGNTTLYENQMIPNENWVSNTIYSDGVGQQLQRQPLNWVASYPTFTESSGIQGLNNSLEPLFPPIVHQTYTGSSGIYQTNNSLYSLFSPNPLQTYTRSSVIQQTNNILDTLLPPDAENRDPKGETNQFSHG